MPINIAPAPYNLFLPFIALVISCMALIVGLDVIWRVEKRLSVVMRFLVLAVLGVAIRKANNVLGNTNSDAWLQAAQYIDIATAACFLFAFLEMFKIVRSLNKEQKQ